MLRRATRTVGWATEHGTLLDIGLDHLSLGRAHLAITPPDLIGAARHLQATVDGFRASGVVVYLPRGLLARAALHRLRDDLPAADKDLGAVATLVRRHGLRLSEADLALERTRYHLAAGDAVAARDTLTHARALIEEMGYGRRLPELAELEAALH